MPILHKHLEVSPALAGRLDRVVQHLTGKPRREVRGLFDHQCVHLNGQVAQAVNLQVQPGDVVLVRYDDTQRYHEQPQAHPRHDSRFRLVYEDEHLLVVDKAAFVLTVPTERGETNTLVHALQRHINQGNVRSRGRAARRVEVVHRLDRGTSGLLVFAKTRAVAEGLQAQFGGTQGTKPEREYVALVAGVPQPAEGTFESYLATAPNLKRYSALRPEEGELAVTHYRVEQVAPEAAPARAADARDAATAEPERAHPRRGRGRDPAARKPRATARNAAPPAGGAALVRLWLDTGRRNQIRVHFAEAGHPVLGDPRYRPDLAGHPRWTARRLALHATVLGFAHPVTGIPLRFESPLPRDFQTFLRGR